MNKDRMSAQHTPAPFRAEWINGTWYAVRQDGSALSNKGHAEERAAMMEIAEYAAELECAHDDLVAALREIDDVPPGACYEETVMEIVQAAFAKAGAA